MKKRIVAMVLAGTMVFSQNVYATELSDGTGQTMTEQTETEQQDTNAVEKEYAQSEQQNSEMLDDDENKDVDNSADANEEDSYWEEIQQYASDDDDSGVFDEELYKSNLNSRKRTLYVGNPIVIPIDGSCGSDGYDITVSDNSICKVTKDSFYDDYNFIRLEPLKPGTTSFSVKDSDGDEIYNCDVTVLENLPEDAAPIKDIEIRSWFFARTYYGQDGYISKDELSHINFFSFGYGCREGYIKDLSGLEYATGLKTIDLSYTGVKDVSPIMKLNNLENLDISGMKMDDYSWLSNFSKMKRLDISRTKIQDFSFLNNMPELEKLNVASTSITDFSFLKNMPELEELNVGNTSITDLDFLKNLKNYKKLETLCVYDTAVSDLDAISGFVNIRRKTNLDDVHKLREYLLIKLNLKK